MSEPAPLADGIAAALAQIRVWQATPEGRAHVEQGRRQEAARSRRLALDLADLRGVPTHPGTRAIASLPRLPPGPATVALERLAAWRREHPRYPAALCFSGPPGTGKTCALAWSICHARRARYVLAHEVSTAPATDHPQSRAERAALITVPTLAVDEVGLERGDPERLAQLLCDRHEQGGLTLLATNLSRAEVEGRYLGGALGARVLSRLGAQREVAWWAPVTGTDLRAGGVP